MASKLGGERKLTEDQFKSNCQKIASTNTNPLARPDPNHQVVYLPDRPDFTIRFTGGSSRNCYHESYYEVISRHEMDAGCFEHLDACGLLGFGQEYRVLGMEKIIDDVKPVTVDRRTGERVPDVPPVSWRGELIADTQPVVYFRYTVRRICDSGD